MRKLPFKKDGAYDSSDKRSHYNGRRKRSSLIHKLTILTIIAILMAGAFGAFLFGIARSDSTNSDAQQLFQTDEIENNPLSGKDLYVNPDTYASRQADEWRQTEPVKAKAMDRLADLPIAQWYSA